jgi:hypothetical protein
MKLSDTIVQKYRYECSAIPLETIHIFSRPTITLLILPYTVCVCMCVFLCVYTQTQTNTHIYTHTHKRTHLYLTDPTVTKRLNCIREYINRFLCKRPAVRLPRQDLYYGRRQFPFVAKYPLLSMQCH